MSEDRWSLAGHDEPVWTLPDREELANRLVAVDGTGYVVKNLYPKILRNAGTEVSSSGLVAMFVLAVSTLDVRLTETLRAQVYKYVVDLAPEGEPRDQALAFLARGGLPTGPREGDGS